MKLFIKISLLLLLPVFLLHRKTCIMKNGIRNSWIVALADEYLRLAYHGLRAKDPRDSANNSFNATMKTDYDETIGNINIIPQDI